MNLSVILAKIFSDEGDRENMPFGRKTFLSGTALASVVGLASCSGGQQTVAKNDQLQPLVLSSTDYDLKVMISQLDVPNAHKQVFLALGESWGFLHVLRIVKPDVADLYRKMQTAMNGYEFSLGPSGSKLATLGILVGDNVILGLNDAMWQRYQIGHYFNCASTNIYYHAKSNLDTKSAPNDPTGLYHDWSAQAVLKRGGSFMVCHNALAGLAKTVAAKAGANPQTALDNMSHNLLPGFILVPSGILAMQLAQEHGWKIYTPT